MASDSAAWIEQRVGAAGAAKKALRYVFPDHWSFMLGEIALYAFLFLIASGIYLTLFFSPSTGITTYTGNYAPLHGVPVTEAYRSTVELSLNVPAGLMIRQAHHWAADLFVVAIVLHLMRVFFTGAFRKPRDLNWFIGLTMLMLAVFEGFAGYSLPGDLMSGMGLAIAYGVLISIPVVGVNLAQLFFAGNFPGHAAFESRLFIAHVLLVPITIAVLLTLHLTLVARQHHTQFPGRLERERNVVGTPMWPGYALRSLALGFAVAAVLVLLGGLVQINPVWQWGPNHTYLSTNGAQPDWYLGWLIGALRMMPNWEPVVFGHTLIPNPFFGGALFPTVVFAALFLYPAVERRLSGDRAEHHVLERPRDNPWRTAFGAAFFTWVAVVFVAGSADRILVRLQFSYPGQIWFFRVAAIVGPLLVFAITFRICDELRRSGLHPLRGWQGGVVARRPADGAYDQLLRRDRP